MKKRILLILLIFVLSIGFVSASENTTDHEDISSVNSNDIPISDDEPMNVKKVYVNASKETNGDGSSWENATNNVNIQKEIFFI